MNSDALLVAAFALSTLCTSITAFADTKSVEQAQSHRLAVEGPMPSLDRATSWLNSDPLSATELRGKVVLVDFWTYTCINWIRTAPYLRAWSEKYSRHGLVVIGVHSPEFAFEKNTENVKWAVEQMNIRYPVAVDSNHSIWRAFDNNYWPALYFVDAQGRIRSHQFGEGDYARAEQIIQQLLIEAGATGVDRGLVTVDPRGIELAADWRNLRSGERYLGYERTENFASTSDAALDRSRVYALPSRLPTNHWALAGSWTMQKQMTRLNKANGRIAYRFQARDLHLVMGPAVKGKPVRFRVLIDGKPPADSHGSDTDPMGYGTAVEERLYHLIRQRGTVEQRHFEIEFLDEGLEAYAFTFG
jgi:thiol-disulfide isomerase/thioredoxin